MFSLAFPRGAGAANIPIHVEPRADHPAESPTRPGIFHASPEVVVVPLTSPLAFTARPVDRASWRACDGRASHKRFFPAS